MSNQVTATASIDLRLDFAPWRLSGVVVGAALNDPALLAALGAAVNAPPYKAAPRAPVLYLKPRNTLRSGGSAVPAPAAAGFDIGATLGLVIGRETCRVEVAQALDCVAGWVLVADLNAPYESHYRPGARFKARDGSCLLGVPVAAPAGGDPAAVTLRVAVDGQTVHVVPLAGLQRTAAQLIADVSEFMTLNAGDVLLLGTRVGAPRVRAGQHFSIEAALLGSLHGSLV